jgi:hypothetical protein
VPKPDDKRVLLAPIYTYIGLTPFAKAGSLDIAVVMYVATFASDTEINPYLSSFPVAAIVAPPPLGHVKLGTDWFGGFKVKYFPLVFKT